MKNIIIINGPNLNLLGDREEEIYGKETLEIIKNKCIKKSEEVKLICSFYQNNSEGDIIDHIQSVNNNFDGLIINPAAFTHTSVALLDALRTVKKPKIEIHLSNIYKRESYRRKSITSEGVDGLICGFDSLSYILAIEALSKLIYK
jgi:3-dehydroquinate dehydratase-2